MKISPVVWIAVLAILFFSQPVQAQANRFAPDYREASDSVSVIPNRKIAKLRQLCLGQTDPCRELCQVPNQPQIKKIALGYEVRLPGEEQIVYFVATLAARSTKLITHQYPIDNIGVMTMAKRVDLTEDDVDHLLAKLVSSPAPRTSSQPSRW